MKNNNCPGYKPLWPMLLIAFSLLQGCHLLPSQHTTARSPITESKDRTLIARVNHNLKLSGQELEATYRALNAIPERQRTSAQTILLATLLSHEKLPDRNLGRALRLLSGQKPSAESSAGTRDPSREQLAELLYQIIARQQAMEEDLANAKENLITERNRRTTLENQLRALKEVETGIIRRESNQPTDSTHFNSTPFNKKGTDKGAP